MDERPGLHADDIGKLLLRLTVGGLMLFHGIFKIMNGLEEISRVLTSTMGGAAGAVAYGVYIGEIVAPVLIILGFWTRLGAAILAVDMVVAVLLVHAPKGELGALNQMGGWAVELQAWYFLAAVAVLFLGAGKISVSGGKGRLD
jgi:putative oxidoreductase